MPPVARGGRAELSGPGDLFSLLGGDEAPETNREDSPPAPAPKRAARRTRAKAADDAHGPPEIEAAPEPLDASPQPSTSSRPDDRLVLALLALDSADAVRDRAVDILSAIDPDAADRIPAALPFPPEDDPFTKTLEEWEAVWYA